MSDFDHRIETFRSAAESVSAVVSSVISLEDAMTYAVDLCQRKDACQLLVSGCEEALSPPADALCELKQQKVIAAPGLGPDSYLSMETLCRSQNIRLIDRGLRNHLAGIDIGFTIADYGIAETGTLVIDSSDEDLRLATMISEVHIAVLPQDRIRSTALDLLEQLGAAMGASPNYMAFITGASRTADIERVLALGVHGPLELHILIIEE